MAADQQRDADQNKNHAEYDPQNFERQHYQGEQRPSEKIENHRANNDESGSD
jgi:hypothetical protein